MRWWHWERTRLRSRLMRDFVIIAAGALSYLAVIHIAFGCVGPVASPAEFQRFEAGGDATANQTQALVAVAGALVDASAHLAASVEQSATAGRDAATGGVVASQATAGRDIYSGLDGGTVAVLVCLFGLAAWKTVWRWRLARQAGLGLNERFDDM